MSERGPLGVGSMVAKYRLDEQLGEGGMGVVFMAFDTELKRIVALKLLHPRVATDAGRRRRFLREGRLAARVNHPCIATIYAVGEADDRIFIAMELCEGKSLARILHEQGKMSGADALRTLREVVRGLRKAHEAGIIHRDLKPDNVVVADDGIVKVLDFGIAKPLESADTGCTDTRTQHGSLIGTPAYMSPEQAAGREVDARSDIFSLGVLLYEMLSTRRPFNGDTWQEIIISINRDEVVPLSKHRQDLAPGIDELVQRCMNKAPAERFQSCTELLAEIDDLLARFSGFVPGPATITSSFPALPLHPTTDGPVSREAPSAPPPRSRRPLLIAGVAVVAVAGAMWGLFGRGGGADGHAGASASAQPTDTAGAHAGPDASSAAMSTHAPDHSAAPPPSASASASLTAEPTGTPSASVAAPTASARVGPRVAPPLTAPPVPPPAVSSAPPPPPSGKPKNPRIGF